MIFVGSVFGVNDSLNFHGKGIDEITEMFHQTVDNYLELCAELGKQPDKEFRGSFTLPPGNSLRRSLPGSPPSKTVHKPNRTSGLKTAGPVQCAQIPLPLRSALKNRLAGSFPAIHRSIFLQYTTYCKKIRLVLRENPSPIQNFRL